MNKNTRNALLVLCLIIGTVYAVKSAEIGALWNPFSGLFPGNDTGDPGAQYSPFKWTGVAEDATSTSVTSATSRCWFDKNGDSVMQYSEIGTFTESSGVYTTDMEYPIDYSWVDNDGETHFVSFDLWVQCYATNYQITYKLVHLTGKPASDLSAKSVGQIELRATDDSITWDGTMNGAAFDTSDYNATLSGTTGTLKAEFILSAADKGISSQVWEGIDYMKAYGITKDHDYVVKWDEITEGVGDSINIASASILAPTFFCAYSTIQDKVDGAINVASFDLNFNDGTNWYNIEFVSSAMGDLMYNTADSVAPRPFVSIPMGVITGVGTFAATYGIGIWQGVTYDQMLAGSWTKGTTLALGTCGNGWGWALGATSAP